jgi:glycosyltransferase involved in cell wall biosynthesis
MTPRGRLGFVPPRYGSDVVGGAEAVMRETAMGFAQRGWDVEVLTTCARDHFSWENVYPAGVEERDGLMVRRFPTIVSTPRVDRGRLEKSIMAGERLTLADQERWINDDLRVPELFHYLLDRSGDYLALFFAPYLFWTTYACAQIAPQKSILIPCLHDEPYAYLDIYRPVFTGVQGVWFLSEPELMLAETIFDLPDRKAVVGSGIHVPASYDEAGFRSKFDVNSPFVLFAGRREGGKGWEEFLESFSHLAPHIKPELTVVTIGTGEVTSPPPIRHQVVDLGFLSTDDRNNAFAAASAYIQPSRYESFSRTLMESWLAGTIVIANGASDVVRWHCERSGAGLTFEDELELGQCLRFIAEYPNEAAALASGGRDYVLSNYSWEKVLDTMESRLEEWMCAS